MTRHIFEALLNFVDGYTYTLITTIPADDFMEKSYQ